MERSTWVRCIPLTRKQQRRYGAKYRASVHLVDGRLLHGYGDDDGAAVVDLGDRATAQGEAIKFFMSGGQLATYYRVLVVPSVEEAAESFGEAPRVPENAEI